MLCEGLDHLDVGSLWNVDMPVSGAAVGIMIGGWPPCDYGTGKLQHGNAVDLVW